MKKSRATALVAAAAATALMLAGCAQDAGSGGDEAGAGGNVDVKMSYVAFSGIAPTLLAIDNGSYERHGLNVEGSVAASPAAILSGLVNGELQIGFTTIPTLISAVQEGVPIKCIASADGIGAVAPPAEISTALLVAPDSAVTSAAELEGKRIGVIALGSLNHLIAMDLIAQAGGDPSTVEFVQLPLPQTGDALAGHQVDAAITTEPFTLPLLDKEFRMLGSADAPGGLTSERTTKCYAASDEYIEKNPETVAKFIVAQDEALTYAQDHLDEALATLPQILELSPEAALATETGLIFQPGITPADVEHLQDKMVEFGWVDETRSVKDYVYSPGDTE